MKADFYESLEIPSCSLGVLFIFFKIRKQIYDSESCESPTMLNFDNSLKSKTGERISVEKPRSGANVLSLTFILQLTYVCALVCAF